LRKEMGGEGEGGKIGGAGEGQREVE